MYIFICFAKLVAPIIPLHPPSVLCTRFPSYCINYIFYSVNSIVSLYTHLDLHTISRLHTESHRSQFCKPSLSQRAPSLSKTPLSLSLSPTQQAHPLCGWLKLRYKSDDGTALWLSFSTEPMFPWHMPCPEGWTGMLTLANWQKQGLHRWFTVGRHSITY